MRFDRMGMAADDTVSGKKYRKLLQQAQLYFTVLKKITRYESVDWIRKFAEKNYGVSGPEAIEMAYENVLAEAETAIKGKRFPE